MYSQLMYCICVFLPKSMAENTEGCPPKRRAWVAYSQAPGSTHYDLNAFPKLKRKQSDHKKRSEQGGGAPRPHLSHTLAQQLQESDPTEGVSGGNPEGDEQEDIPARDEQEDIPVEENVVPFTDTDTYQCLLLESERVLVVGGGTMFVLNHYNMVTKCLDNDKLVVVERRPVVFQQCWSYVYKCSCDHHHGRLVEALSSNLEQSFGETSCIHVKALTQVLHNLNVPEVPEVPANQEDGPLTQ
ncbi:uncharacterized protein LOC134087078 isoform X2 [Sardina pilchardus]|uniref:uncharacterized protein LOC134087078 isoform X2 n=1 Tax=Sardina pilchardus TaxID=27697 RepID=UPI002E0E4359